MFALHCFTLTKNERNAAYLYTLNYMTMNRLNCWKCILILSSLMALAALG